MKLPSDAPKLPKLIFLFGDAALILTAWYIARESSRPLTGMTLLAISSCVIVGVVIGAFPFIADYSRRQEEALDDRQRSLHSLSVTVAASAEQIAIAATGLQGLAAAAQDNLEKSERISVQIQEKMTELQALLAAAKKDDGDAATRLESVAEKINSSVAALEAAGAKAAEAGRAIPSMPAPAPEVPPVPASRIVKIKPAAAPSESPFDAPPAPPEEAPPAPVSAPDPVPEAAPAVVTAPAKEPAPAQEPAPAPAPAPRKRSPRKAAATPAAVPAPDLMLESPPAPDAELPLASPVPEDTAPAEPAVSADGATRLIVTAYIGIGNRLFIRGEGPGLTWEKGVPLSFVSIGKWRWETNDASRAVKFKIYKNDEIECSALGEQSLEPGAQQDLTASF